MTYTVSDVIRFGAELRRYVDLDAEQACSDEIRARINWYGYGDIVIIDSDDCVFTASVYTRNLEKIASFTSADAFDMLRQLGEYIGWRRYGDAYQYLYRGEWCYAANHEGMAAC